MKAILYVDGSCIGNPGPAGVGIVYFRNEDTIIEKALHIGNATNNIAEIRAVIEGLKLIPAEWVMDVTIYTDSALVKGFIDRKWQAKKNVDLVMKMLLTCDLFKSVTVVKVKGHTGDKYNERCNTLAYAAASRELKDYVTDTSKEPWK